MDRYLEQSVSAPVRAGKRLLAMLAWMALILLVILALLLAANVLGEADGALRLNWPCGLGLVLCGAAAWCIWRSKDRLHTEYDYFLREDRLEVWAVLNSRRRQCRVKLQLQDIRRVSTVDAAAQQAEKAHAWYLHGDVPLTRICYMEGNQEQKMLLELSEEMRDCLKAGLNRGVWQEK